MESRRFAEAGAGRLWEGGTYTGGLPGVLAGVLAGVLTGVFLEAGPGRLLTGVFLEAGPGRLLTGVFLEAGPGRLLTGLRWGDVEEYDMLIDGLAERAEPPRSGVGLLDRAGTVGLLAGDDLFSPRGDVSNSGSVPESSSLEALEPLSQKSRCNERYANYRQLKRAVQRTLTT